jgi:tetratricopeptide (TPR) repeat protein
VLNVVFNFGVAENIRFISYIWAVSYNQPKLPMFKITRLTAIVLLLFISAVSYSQNNIDSLKAIFNNPKQFDSNRARAVVYLIANLPSQNKEYTEYLEQLKILVDKNLKKKEASAKEVNFWKAYAAQYYMTKAQKGFEGNQMDGVLESMDKGIELFTEVKDNLQVANALVSRGLALKRLKRPQEAIESLYKGIKLMDQANDKAGVAYAQMSIASLYEDQENLDGAIELYKKALAYNESIKSPSVQEVMAIAELNTRLGDIYLGKKQFDLSEKYHQEALKLSTKNKSQLQMSANLTSLARINFVKGKSEVAYDMMKQALALKQSDLYKSNIYIALGEFCIEEKKYKEGEEYLKLAMKMGRKDKSLKSWERQVKATRFLSRLYTETREFDKAAQMFELYNTYRDSIKETDSRNLLLKQQLKYDFEKKELQQKIEQEKELSGMKLMQARRVAALKLQAEKETAEQESKNKLAQQQLTYDFEKKALNQEIDQQRKVSAIKLDAEKVKLDAQKKTAVKNNWLIGLSGILLLVLLGLYFYYRNNKQKQAITVLEKDQIKQKLLVSQMNPHFIFNSIENIQQLIYDNKDQDAVNYLSKFSVLTRQILENSNENYISLSEEVAMIGNYLAIQQLLYSNKFDFTIAVEESIDAETIFLPPMLTQPFIENAIKHGLAAKDTNGMVDISFYLNEGKLFFEVLDNGKGFDASKRTDNHKSLAMVITKERLVNYTKNQDFVVQTDNIKDKDEKVVGAKVVFEIPYIYEN